MLRSVLYTFNGWPNLSAPFIFGSPFIYDEKGGFRGATQDENIELSDAFWDHCQSLSSTMMAFPGQLLDTYLGSYLLTSSGEPPVTDTYQLTVPAVKVSNAPFNKKVREGEIVVANYTSAIKITVSAEAPWTQKSASYYDRVGGIPLSAFLTSVPSPDGSSGSFTTYRGKIYKGGFMRIAYRHTTEESGSFFGNYTAEGHCKVILGRLDTLGKNSGLVTTALAAANRGQFDFLSNLAELPETIESIYRGIAAVLEMYREAKRGEVRFYNKLSRKLLKTGSYAQQRKEAAITADAVAGLWLSYRLAIEPTVGMVYDAATILRDGYKAYFRYRELERSAVSVAYSSEKSEITIAHRVCIKRSYDLFASALGFPPIGAAWELVPLSFVLDRFINIGDWLTAHLSPNLSVEEGATYSWSNESSTVPGTTDNGIRYTVGVSFYKRQIINPRHYCGIVLPESRSWKQDLDHLALFWTMVVDKHFKSKRMK